jgi:hypothetical protein
MASSPAPRDRPERSASRKVTTFNRAIKSGKLSAVRGDDGSYPIDPSELTHAYPLTGPANGQMARSVTGEESNQLPSQELVAALRLLAERERLVEEQAETIRDMRARLDEAAEHQRRLLVLLRTSGCPGGGSGSGCGFRGKSPANPR